MWVGKGRLALLLALAWASAAQAEMRVSAGIADSYRNEAAGMAAVSWLSPQAHPWEVMAGQIAARERVGVPEATFVALSKRYAWRRWFVSGGVAWVNVDNDVLSGHGQFMTAAGYGMGRVALSLRHLSNGSTGGRNRGETFLLMEVGF